MVGSCTGEKAGVTMPTKMKPPLTHESGRVRDIGADLAVNLDEPLHADLLDLISGQGVLQPVPQKDDEG